MKEIDKLMTIELNDVDRRIWGEELDEFVPGCVFDIHTHFYRSEFDTSPNKEESPFSSIVSQSPISDWDAMENCDARLLPGRRMHRLAFGCPFVPSCDFEAANRFVAQQVTRDPASAALMLVHPSMGADYLEQSIEAQGFLGFKPYRWYSTTGDAVDPAITDFLPEHQLEVADRHGLLIMMHLAKRDGIADPQNIADLQRFAEQFPNVKWILAHCARSYSSWMIDRAIRHIRELPNVWYGTSTVCDSDTFEVLLGSVGPERVMYGSDDLPHASRGTYITYGYAWAYLGEDNHKLSLAHCNPQMTFVRYEQLRATRRACMRVGLNRDQIDDLFHNTAAKLVASVRKDARRGHMMRSEHGD